MSIRLVTTRFAMLVIAGGIWAVVGCGGGDSPTQPTPTTPSPPTPPPPPPAPTVSVVEVSPSMATVEVGRTQRFVATAKASDGTVIGGVDFAWSSSNTAVATINNNGVATAVAVGTATIRATGNGVSSAAVTITVTVAAVSRITIAPSSAQALMIGEMVTFTATARTAGGVVRDDVSVSWESSDLTVVTITSAGVATAVGAGMATVRATADGIWSPTVTINVAEAPPPEPVVASVTVSPDEAMIEEGATQQFTATASTSDGMEIPDVEFTWSSSDEMVATVDSDGLATGVGAGEAMITATADSISGLAMLTVGVPPTDEPVVASVTVSPDEAMIETDATQQFTAKALTSDGMEIVDAEFTWSSSDEMVATVDSDGLATGVGAGETMITATADSITGMATLTVTEPPPPEPEVASVTVSPSEAMIETDATQQYSATALTADGMEIPDVEFTWSSSDEMVATVDADGLATGVGAGEAMIVATVDSVSGTATLTVTVPPPPEPVVVTVEIVDAIPIILEIGDTHQLMAVARTSDGTMVGGVVFAWSSDDNEVATIDTTGLITAVGAGMAVIIAMTDEITSEPVTVTVAEPPPIVDRVSVSPSTATIEEGETQRFTATAYTSVNEVIPDKTFMWTSSNTTVATINSSGLATAKEAGSTTIEASVDGKSGTASLMVTAPPPQLKIRTATISGTPSYPRTAGSVTFEEVAGGQLKLTITGMNTGGGIAAHLFLYTSASINWRSGPAPAGAMHFGNVTNQPSFNRTFTPSAGETIDSYTYVILHCAIVNMPLGSGSLSN